MSPNLPRSDEARTPQDEAFLQILAHHTMLRAYILAIVRDVHLTEDTLSDATLAIVRSWPKFDQRQSFAPWARGIARRVALTNLRKYQRPELELDEEIMEAVGCEIDSMGSEGVLEDRRQKLRWCVEQLPKHSRDLVQMRYFDRKSYNEISHGTGRSLVALYKAYSRIHEALGHCVRSSLKA